jgi:hypothetical protein
MAYPIAPVSAPIASTKEVDVRVAGPMPPGFTVDSFLTLVRQHLYKKMEPKKWGLQIANVTLMQECLTQLQWDCQVVGMKRNSGGESYALLLGHELVITPRLVRGWDNILAAAEKKSPTRAPSHWDPLSPSSLAERASRCFQGNPPGDTVTQALATIHAALLSALTPQVPPRQAPRL